MRYLTRELAGWLLVGLGLYVFYLCYGLVAQRHVFEAGPMVVVGIFVFRGGIHLLKVAVAAEVCLDARQRAADGRPAVRRSPRQPFAVGAPRRAGAVPAPPERP